MNYGEEEAIFYAEIGYAITEWANIENVLRSLVVRCVPAGRRKITQNSMSVGFFSIETFRAKMDFAEGLVGRRFPKHHEEWETLVADTRKVSFKRNKLAHWLVGKYPQSKAGRRFVLSPWVFPKPKRKTKKPVPPEGSLGLMDIRKMRLDFNHCAIALMKFHDRLQGVTSSLESLVLRHDPPPMHYIRGHFLEGLALQSPPSEEKRGDGKPEKKE